MSQITLQREASAWRVSEVADMARRYQWLNKKQHWSEHRGSNNGSSRAGNQHQGSDTQDLPHCARSQMQVVSATCRDCGTYHQWLQLACKDCVQRKTQQCGLNSIQDYMCKCNIENSKDSWVEPERITRNDHSMIFWDFPMQTDKHFSSLSVWHRADQLQGIDRPHNWHCSAKMLRTSKTESLKRLTNISHWKLN